MNFITGLDHAQVAAPRVPGVEEQARTFYGGLLGLIEIEKPDNLKPKGGVWFSLGVGELHVGLEDAFAPARKAHPALRVQGLAALRARLEAAGVTISEAEPIPGADRFYAHDPFGNRLELIERTSE
jgi:catechol 2,3-dioxygenase-like lactoylglutathione lyase family enzyme